MKKAAIILILIFLANLGFSQIYTLDKAQSTMMIKGTSTLHDWESVVEEFEGRAHFDEETFKNILVTAKVKSIKSGKSAMDKNTYDAMKETRFPEITLNTNSIKVKNGNATGNVELTIAGVTNRIPVSLLLTKSDSLKIIGEIPLKMTAFDIEPPVAVFGTIKTGDQITIVIDFTLEQT